MQRKPFRVLSGLNVAFIMAMLFYAIPGRPASFRSQAKEIAKLMNQGDLEHAIPLIDQLVETAQPRQGGQSYEYAAALFLRGSLRMGLQNTRGAESDLRAAIGILEPISKTKDRERHASLASARSLLGSLLAQNGDLLEAQSLLEEALRTKDYWQKSKPDDAAMAFTAMGTVLDQLGDVAGARKALKEALRLMGTRSGERYPFTALIHAILGMLAVEQGRIEEASRESDLALRTLSQLPVANPALENYPREGADCPQAEKTR